MKKTNAKKMRMLKSTSLAVVVLLCFGCAAFSVAGEREHRGRKHEEKITLDQAPAAVQATITKEAAGKTVDEIEVIMHHDKTIYEAACKADGQETEIRVAADGTLLGTKIEKDDEDGGGARDGDDDDNGDVDETKITLDQAPAAVKDTIVRQVAQGQIEELTLITDDNGKKIYEADYAVNGQDTEIVVAADGKLLAKKIEKGEEGHEDNDSDKGTGGEDQDD